MKCQFFKPRKLAKRASVLTKYLPKATLQIPKIQDLCKPDRSESSNIMQPRHSCIKPQFEPSDKCCGHLSLGYSQASLDLKSLFPFHCAQTRLGLSEMSQDGKLTSLSSATPCLWQIRSLGQCSACAVPKRVQTQTFLWFTIKFGYPGHPLFWQHKPVQIEANNDTAAIFLQGPPLKWQT